MTGAPRFELDAGLRRRDGGGSWSAARPHGSCA